MYVPLGGAWDPGVLALGGPLSLRPPCVRASTGIIQCARTSPVPCTDTRCGPHARRTRVGACGPASRGGIRSRVATTLLYLPNKNRYPLPTSSSFFPQHRHPWQGRAGCCVNAAWSTCAQIEERGPITQRPELAPRPKTARPSCRNVPTVQTITAASDFAWAGAAMASAFGSISHPVPPCFFRLLFVSLALAACLRPP